jgi:NADPH2:quinone reductase
MWFSLTRRTTIAPGETVLVLGAGGGVGLAAVDVAVALGARVIAAASSADKLEVARSVGATDVIDYSTEDLKTRAKELSGGGVDVVVDPVGGDYAEAALRTIARRGRYLVVGFAAGIPRVPLNLPLLSSASIVGVAWSEDLAADPDWLRNQLAAVLRLYEAGKIRPWVSERFPLEQGGRAIARLAERQAIGKVVVQVR